MSPMDHRFCCAKFKRQLEVEISSYDSNICHNPCSIQEGYADFLGVNSYQGAKTNIKTS